MAAQNVAPERPSGPRLTAHIGTYVVVCSAGQIAGSGAVIPVARGRCYVRLRDLWRFSEWCRSGEAGPALTSLFCGR
jgi:hypothetical protein